MTTWPPAVGGRGGSNTLPIGSATRYAGWVPHRRSCRQRHARCGADSVRRHSAAACRVARRSRSPTTRQLLDASDQSCDLVGVLLEPMATGSTAIDDRLADRELERMGELLRMAAEEGPERPLAVASFGSSLVDPDSHGRVVEQLRLAIDDVVVVDGIDVEVAVRRPGRQRRREPPRPRRPRRSAPPQPALPGSPDDRRRPPTSASRSSAWHTRANLDTLSNHRETV